MPGDTKQDQRLWKIRAILTVSALAAAGLFYLVRHLA
jgi:hypothetical protein